MSWWRRDPAPAIEETPPDPNMPVIRLEHVSKVFQGDADEETRALDDVSVDIQRGEYVAVSGPSGCGKSTFLSIIGLLDTPTSGRYWLNGRPISIELPSTAELEVIETAPVMKTATKTASTKPAKLSNGVTIQVPEFISEGERVRVNPRDGAYLERAK